MYLTAIIDWYSRMIVGWNLSDTLDTGYVIQAVKDAVAAHGAPAILRQHRTNAKIHIVEKLFSKKQ